MGLKYERTATTTATFPNNTSSQLHAMTASTIRQPNIQQVAGPVVAVLPAAVASLKPADSILPFLSPILRQRVQLLSSASSNDPWIRLLCYDTSKVPTLTEIARSESLEPHPASGEIEIDWDYDSETQYKRLDEETLQALVALNELGLVFRLVYCTGDPVGDGWKVGEVTVADKPSPFSSFGGVSTIAEAERQYSDSKSKKTAPTLAPNPGVHGAEDEDEDDDDDYWARYDATPGSKTPAAKRSPAPQSMQTSNAGAEDDYYAQYDDVQPAMDNHDPDEEANIDAIAPPLGLANPAQTDGIEEVQVNETQGTWTLAEPPRSPSAHSRSGDDPNLVHPHPRPASSAGSAASVERLEAAAAKQEQSDFGVKQHVSQSIKSLYMLSQASGIDREEFERMVKSELDTFGLSED
ncbi:hypothetical protein F5Y15DRAFT_376387 [Xylariaceae sp. FL0016]|nr:hypothetical protein F5Y15DRAFT_376387 [Xylariaceae sp. FL0016]